MRCFREEVDVLFVPMSFDTTDHPNMKISFASKLTVYTAVGLPLPVFGQPYCSAFWWVGENPGVAEVVNPDDARQLGTAIRRLAKPSEREMRLASMALSVGNCFLSHAAAQSQLHEALLPSRVA